MMWRRMMRRHSSAIVLFKKPHGGYVSLEAQSKYLGIYVLHYTFQAIRNKNHRATVSAHPIVGGVGCRQRQSKLSWLNMQTFWRKYRHDAVVYRLPSWIALAFGWCDFVEVEFFFRLIKYRVSSPLTTSNTAIIKKAYIMVYVCVFFVCLLDENKPLLNVFAGRRKYPRTAYSRF